MTADHSSIAGQPVDVAMPQDNAARNKMVIGLLLVSAFVVILNETIMGVALPRMMASLDITASYRAMADDGLHADHGGGDSDHRPAAAAAQYAAGVHSGDVAVLGRHADFRAGAGLSACWSSAASSRPPAPRS